MKNQCKVIGNSHLFSIFKKLGLFFTLTLFLAVYSFYACCPAKPVWCTEEGANNSDGDVCFYHSDAGTNSVSFSSHINAGRTVYVSVNTKLTLNGNADYKGEIINCGELIFNQNISFGQNSKVTNYGKIIDEKGLAIKGKLTFINETGADFTSEVGLNITQYSQFINYGALTVNQELKVSYRSELRNSGNITINGTNNFTTNGTVINSGTLVTDGFINFNANAETINNCTFIANSGFNSQGISYTNNGNVFVGGNNNASFSKILTTGKNSFISGTNFINTGVISGSGYFHFSGSTNNTGSITSVDESNGLFPMTFNKAISTQNGSITGVVFRDFDKPLKSDYAFTCGQSVTGQLPEVEIDEIAGNDIIDSVEAQSAVIVSGTSNVRDGETVYVSIHMVDYEAIVDNNIWSITVPTTDIDAFNTVEDVVAYVINNDLITSDSVTRSFTMAGVVKITINNITDDNNIDNAESMTDLIITGSTIGILDTIFTLTIFGNDYLDIPVESGQWTITIASAEIVILPLTQTATALISDNSDNDVTAELAFTLSSFEPSIVILPIAGGLPVDQLDVTETLIISGRTDHIEPNQQATLTVLDLIYENINIGDDGLWSVEIPNDALLRFTDGEVVTITVQNQDGVEDTDTSTVSITQVVICPIDNIDCSTGTTSCDIDGNCDNVCPTTSDICATIEFTCAQLDNCALPQILIDDVAGGTEVDQSDIAQTLTITGTSNHVEPNQQATLTVLDLTYTDINITEDGTWSVIIEHDDLLRFTDAEEVTITVSNAAGDEYTDTSTVSITQVVVCAVDETTCSTDTTSCVVDGTCINECPAGSDICATVAFTCEELANCNDDIPAPVVDPAPIVEPAPAPGTLKVKTNLRGVGSVNLPFLILLSLMLSALVMFKAQANKREVAHVKL
ncbi:MAG: hypothetical protein MJK11_06455 [Pseudomonadales bacterium]|nr:hypothetical protein [Pseudomonadales bacterium]